MEGQRAPPCPRRAAGDTQQPHRCRDRAVASRQGPVRGFQGLGAGDRDPRGLRGLSGHAERGLRARPGPPGPAPPRSPRGAAAAPAHIGPLRRSGRAAAAAPGMAQGSTSLWQQQRGTAPWTSCSAPQVTGLQDGGGRAPSPPTPCRCLAGAAGDEAHAVPPPPAGPFPALPPGCVCSRYPPLSLGGRAARSGLLPTAHRPPPGGSRPGRAGPGGCAGSRGSRRPQGALSPRGPGLPGGRCRTAGPGEKGRRARLLASGRARAPPRPLRLRRA